MNDLDYLGIAYPKVSEVDIEAIIREVFDAKVVKNEHYDLLHADKIEGLTIITYLTVHHIQLSSNFWQRPNAFEEVKKIYALINAVSKARIARVDVKRDFPGLEPEDLLPRKYAHSKYFKNSKNAWKPGIIGNPAETINFTNRHAKIRIYDRIKRIQKLIEEKKAKAHHLELLKEFAETGLTRWECELRAKFAEYCDRIFESCSSSEELADQVLNKFLRENPFLDDNSNLHSLWKKLKVKKLNKKQGRKVEKVEKKNSESKYKDILRAQSFIARKFEKWGFTELEAMRFLLKAFGINGPGDFSYLSESETFHSLKAEVMLYRMKYGQLEAAVAKPQAA